MRCRSAPRVMRAWRGKPSDAWGVLGSRVLVRDPDSELLAPLLAAAGQRRTAPLRLHPRTEPVRLHTPRVARAVGGLPHDYSRYGLNEPARIGGALGRLRHRMVNLAETGR